MLSAAQKELQQWVASEPEDEAADDGGPHRLVALAAPASYRPCALPEFGDRMLRLERFEPDAEGPDPRLALPGAAVVCLWTRVSPLMSEGA